MHSGILLILLNIRKLESTDKIQIKVTSSVEGCEYKSTLGKY